MTRILDNIAGNELGHHLVQMFESFDRMDVAVGYFNLRGWRVFVPLVESRAGDGPLARILIGMVAPAPDREALAELQADVDGQPQLDADGETARGRKLELLDHLRMQLMRGIPTPQDRKTLKQLRDALEAHKVSVRVFTERPLHGKTYIFHRQDVTNPIAGIVGSSNLTYPGLTSNLELNVDVLDSDAASKLSMWFEDRWNDRFSMDVTVDLLDLIDESWASPKLRSPYEVFLKLCYDLARDVREGLAEYTVPAQIAEILLDYQTTAVRTLARRVMTRRGAMLGDVVGLGKTLTAIAVALMLRDEHGFQPLIICPKNLRQMWEDHLEEYDLHGRVVHYDIVAKTLPELRRYPFVIVDESHTLRNNQRQDYIALRDYIFRNDSKVLLLTATPFNIRFNDVANQIALYVDDDDDLGIAPVSAIRNDPSIVDKVDSKITTLQAFRLSDEADDWKRLMSEQLVRRTRSFIQTNYSKVDAHGNVYLEFADGRRFSFPRRTPVPIQHSFGDEDPASKMADNRTLDTINSLVLPRYELAQFVLRNRSITEEEQVFVERVLRGRGHVAGFVRTMLFKRLSSCGYSFILSLQRHIARNELWLYALANGLPVPTGDIPALSLGDDVDPVLDEEGEDVPGSVPQQRYDSLRSVETRSVHWVRSDLFSEELQKALLRDTAALQELVEWYGEWSALGDSKLQELITLLRGKHAGEKVLVFTEYKDTAEYLGEQLDAAGISAVGVATGASQDPTRLAARFSPNSNERLSAQAVAEDGEIQVLVATDVLSEGQNLQDAHIVVNFDLPWAIIRLIQRAGRVDRIGQKSSEVVIYSFFHESVDNVISLRQRIGDRLAANAAAFGSDEAFFGSAGETQIITDLYNGELDEKAPDEDVDAASLAYQYWNQAVEDDPTLETRVPRMPDLVDATRAKRLGEPTGGVACYVRTAGGVDGFAMADSHGNINHLTGHEALAVFRAEKLEPGLPLRQDHDELVTKIVRSDLSIVASASGRLRGVRKRVWARLGETLPLVTDQDYETQIALEALYQHPLTHLADTRLKRALRNGLADADLTALVRALNNDGNLVISTRSGEDPMHIITTMGVTER